MMREHSSIINNKRIMNALDRDFGKDEKRQISINNIAAKDRMRAWLSHRGLETRSGIPSGRRKKERAA
jgi:hypothetical protein